MTMRYELEGESDVRLDVTCGWRHQNGRMRWKGVERRLASRAHDQDEDVEHGHIPACSTGETLSGFAQVLLLDVPSVVGWEVGQGLHLEQQVDVDAAIRERPRSSR